MSVPAKTIGAGIPAVAADAPDLKPITPRSRAASPSSPVTLTVPAEAVGGHGNHFDRFRHASRVDRVKPYAGWQLFSFVDWDFDAPGSHWTSYVARSLDHDDVLLGVSRLFFEPTDERFRWLVDNGLPGNTVSPATGIIVPLTNAHIDRAIEAEMFAANCKHRLAVLNTAAGICMILGLAFLTTLGVAAHG